jgi:hypothetical protein
MDILLLGVQHHTNTRLHMQQRYDKLLKLGTRFRRQLRQLHSSHTSEVVHTATHA